MRKLIASVAVLGLMAALVVASPNFSGTYAFNASKSVMPQPGGGGGRGMGGTPKSVKVEQTGDSIKVTRVSEGRDGQVRETVMNYKAGAEADNTAGGPGGTTSTFKVKSKWEGDALTASYSRTVQSPNGEFKFDVTEKISLSADGKTLTIETTRKSEQGETTTKQVFEKQ